GYQGSGGQSTAWWNVPRESLAPERCYRAGRAARWPLDDTQVTRRGAPGGNEQGDQGLFHRGMIRCRPGEWLWNCLLVQAPLLCPQGKPTSPTSFSSIRNLPRFGRKIPRFFRGE